MIRRISALGLAFIKRRWPERIEYVKSKDCSFVRRDIPAGTKINSALVDLNYSSLSPFPSPEIVYLARKTKISLWFIRPRANNGQSGRFVFPEGLLLASNYVGSETDSILIHQEKDGAEFITVRQGRVVSQFIKPVQSETEHRQVVDLLIREHGLQSPRIRTLTAEERVALLNKGSRHIGVRELVGFWVPGRKGKQEFVEIFGRLLPPVLLFFVLYTMIQVGGSWMLQEKINTTGEHLASLQQQLQPLLAERMQEEENVDFWRFFIENETARASLVSAYQSVALAVLELDGHLIRWSGVKDRVTFTVVVDEAAALLDILRRGNHFKSIRFDGAVRKERKTEQERATLSLELGNSGKE